MEQLQIKDRWNELIGLLKGIESELKVSNTGHPGKVNGHAPGVQVHVPFRGSEIYLLQKAFVDAGGAAHETYKSLLEKTAPYLANKSQRGFSVESLQKNSDKVDYEAKENVKRFLTKMIRNIDSY